MQEKIVDFLKTNTPRLVAIAVGALLSFLQHRGYILPEGFDVHLTDLITFMLVYSLSHKQVSKKTNPADAATTTAKPTRDPHGE